MNDLLQLATLITVFAGAALVLWELKQNRLFAQAQLISEGLNMNRQAALSWAGENPMEAFAKACETTDSLDASDILVLEFVFLENILTIHRAFRLEKIGIYTDGSYLRYIAPRTEFMFSTPIGRAWWEQRKMIVDPVLSDAIDAHYRQLGPTDCSAMISKMKQRASEIEGRL